MAAQPCVVDWVLALLVAAEPFGPAVPRPPERAGEPCATDGEEIVVCGRRRGDRSLYRLPEATATPAEPLLPKAELGIGHGRRIAVETEQAGVGGFVSNRAMLRLKVPLGRRR